jgi:photosystem II stability/assembly factor-like uncharacterized protein
LQDPNFGRILGHPITPIPISMKKAVLLLFSLYTLQTQAQWRTIYQGPDSLNNVLSASFFSPTAGFIATNKWIGYTIDSGYTYQQRYIGNGNVNFGTSSVNLTFGFSPSDIQAFNGTTLVASGNYGYEPSVLYSTDGGNSWTLAYHKNLPGTDASANSVYQMSFPGGGSAGYAVQHNEIIKTINGGQSWTTTLGGGDGYFTVTATSASTVYAASTNTIMKSTNSGFTWGAVTGPFQVQAMTVVGAQHIYVLTTVGDTYSSVDGGTTWVQQNTPAGQVTASFINSIHFINDSAGYLAAGVIYETRNSGKSWEVMPSSYPTKNYSLYQRFVFYNTQQAWVTGNGETMLLTGNDGGTTIPRALFSANTSQVCTNNTVQLVNQSQPGYSYRWYLNNAFLASTFNASYTTVTGSDVVSLVVSNGILSDSTSQPVSSTTASTIQLNVVPRQDTVCGDAAVRFDVFNSQSDVQYQVRRACCSPSSYIPGNGGSISIPYYTNPAEDSVSVFTVFAVQHNACGTDSTQQTFPIRLVLPNPPTATAVDTVCKQGTLYIRVTNSRVGYRYWVDGSRTVPGTGDTISLPAGIAQASSSTNIDSYGYLQNYQFPVYLSSVTEGCSGRQITTATEISRYPGPNFNIAGNTFFTGDTMPISNTSKYATNYLWKAGDGSSFVTNTGTIPTPPLSYSTPGYKHIGLVAYTKEGCADSIETVVTLYGSNGNTAATPICSSNSPDYVVDSFGLGGSWYYVTRAIYEDEHGGRVQAGGFTSGASAGGLEGWWATKRDKNGQLLWSLYQNELDYYHTYEQYPHTIIESAVSDSLGNTYLMGHEISQQYVGAHGEMQVAVQGMADFLIKVTAAGHIAWIKPFNSMDGSNSYQFSSGGTLLRGKGNTLWWIAQRYPGSSYMTGSTTLFAAGEGHEGVILVLDTAGNMLRKNSYLTQWVNLYNGLQGTVDNYCHVPPASFAGGKLVIYTTLYGSQATLENASVGFSSTNIPSALAVFDTATLHAVSVKPVFSMLSGAAQGVSAETYAMDSTGSYYASFTGNVSVPPPAYPPTQFPVNTVTKTYIEAYDGNGNLRWTKTADGLEPKRMLAFGDYLKIAGSNYVTTFWNNDQGVYSVPGGAYLDSSRRLTTAVTDAGGSTGNGGPDIASSDIVLATLQTSDGQLVDYRALGSKNEDERITMAKGAGNQLWVAGSVNTRWTTGQSDMGYQVNLYKIPITNDCYGGYPNQAPFLKWTIGADTTACTDSLYTLSWSSTGTGPLAISFSTDSGMHYTSLATNIAAGTYSYTFNALQAGALGNVNFIIQDDSSSLADTTQRRLSLSAVDSVTISASDTSICSGSTVRFKALAVNGGVPGYQWLVNQMPAGANVDTLVLMNLNNGDAVQVKMTGSTACSSPAVASSNTILMAVTMGVAPGVVIDGGTSSVQGQADTLYAYASNAGAAPVYKWQDSTVQHGWAVINGASDSVLHYIAADSGDRVRCQVTGQTLCSPVDSAVSNPLFLSVRTVPPPPGDSTVVPPPVTPPPGDSTVVPPPVVPPSDTTKTDTTSNAASNSGVLHLFPNPVWSSLTIDTLVAADGWQTLDVLDMNGGVLGGQRNIANLTSVTINVAALAKGTYLIRIVGRKRTVYLRMLKL